MDEGQKEEEDNENETLKEANIHCDAVDLVNNMDLADALDATFGKFFDILNKLFSFMMGRASKLHIYILHYYRPPRISKSIFFSPLYILRL